MSEFNTEHVHRGSSSRLRVREWCGDVELTINNDIAPYNSNSISLDLAALGELVRILDDFQWDRRLRELADDAEQ